MLPAGLKTRTQDDRNILGQEWATPPAEWRRLIESDAPWRCGTWPRSTTVHPLHRERLKPGEAVHPARRLDAGALAAALLALGTAPELICRGVRSPANDKRRDGHGRAVSAGLMVRRQAMLAVQPYPTIFLVK